MNPIHHPLSDSDRAAVDRIRQMAAPAKGVLERTAFDTVMERTAPADGVVYEAARIGGVPGWWVRPEGAPAGVAILYLHGGGYIVGSAKAYRNFVGHIAKAAGFGAFVADYRLAPEHAFAAALEDAVAAYYGLAGQGVARLLLAGDSAGGGLALALLALATTAARNGPEIAPLGATVLSPWTDLALTSSSLEAKADADPFLTRDALQSAADQYLAGHDPRDPNASPLYGDTAGLPPVLIQVGEDEILLDDARRYAERFAADGGDVRLHQWAGMPHVFPANVGVLAAAQPALNLLGQFLRDACARATTTETAR